VNKVFQERVHPEEGDCLRACVATILNLNLVQVPNFSLYKDDWFLAVVSFSRLYDRLPQSVSLPDEFARCPKGVPVIVSGASPRFPGKLHAVVSEYREGAWHLLHDPVQGGTGIVGDPVDAIWFVEGSEYNDPPLPPNDTKAPVAALEWIAMEDVILATRSTRSPRIRMLTALLRQREAAAEERGRVEERRRCLKFCETEEAISRREGKHCANRRPIDWDGIARANTRATVAFTLAEGIRSGMPGPEVPPE